jgi:hypothetical protein
MKNAAQAEEEPTTTVKRSCGKRQGGFKKMSSFLNE